MASSGSVDLFCKSCGSRVKKIDRTNDETVGRGKLPLYVHAPRKYVDDPVTCAKNNLTEDEVTQEDWWNGGS